MNLWLALRRLLPLLAVLSLALTPVTAPAATAGMHAKMSAAVHDHHGHAMPDMDTADDASGNVGMADMAMDDMPCCPHEKAAKPDCAKGCPLMALCLATVASLLPTAVVLPAPVGSRASMAWPAPASLASVNGTPLPEPPRA